MSYSLPIIGVKTILTVGYAKLTFTIDDFPYLAFEKRLQDADAKLWLQWRHFWRLSKK